MCGNAGCSSTSPELCEGANLHRMLGAIDHRGPDDTGLCRSRRGCPPERHRIREEVTGAFDQARGALENPEHGITREPARVSSEEEIDDWCGSNT